MLSSIKIFKGLQRRKRGLKTTKRCAAQHGNLSEERKQTADAGILLFVDE